MKLSLLTKSVFVFSVILSVGLYAEDDDKYERLNKLKETVNKIMSKAGIHFGGEFRSQFMNSTVDGNAVNEQRRITETVEYTSVDFDIQARPNTAVQGRAILRLHQDWRIMFSDLGNPINARWLSIDGRILNNTCGYNLGYFKTKYTPLTLYSPDIEIEYEPEIFAFSREMAMRELFLEDNKRINQGLSYDVDIAIKPILEELHFNIQGSRLRLSETTLQNANFVSLDSESKMDKYCIGANLDLVFIPDMTLGFSFLDIFDWKETSNEDSLITDDILQTDTLAQKTIIYDFRGGVGTAKFLDPQKANFSINAEVAFSGDDSSFVTLDSINDTLFDTSLSSEKIKGKALAINFLGSVGIGSVGNARLNLCFRRNDELYRNEMAQTPSFIPNRIMNSENDYRNINNNVNDTLYTTFDALYRHVYKFAASGQNGYVRRPMRKTSYGNAILTQHELAGLALDPALQLIMPFGPATPNRIGIEGSVSLSFFDNGIRTGISFLSMNEVKEGDSIFVDSNSTVGITNPFTYQPPMTSFFEIGFGASVDIASFIAALDKPIRLSGGFKTSKAANDGLGSEAVTKSEINVNWANAGLYWNFWKRASLLFGFQSIVMTDDAYNTNDLYTYIQNKWAAGLEYKVKEGGSVTGTVGQISGSQECDNDAIDLSGNEFTQLQVDLFLTVSF